MTIALLAITAPALADEKTACFDAAENAQQQRAEGKLRDARVLLHVCVRDVCPAVVRNDCTQWLTEVEASLPTIVLRATGPRGQDVNDVKVMLDGQALVDKIDGLPIEVDPGPHVVTATRPGSKPVRQDLTFYTNQRNRTVSLILEDISPPPEGTGELRVSSRPARPGALPYVLAGVAVGATVSWAYFGLSSLTDKKHLEATCGPNAPGNTDGLGHCPASDVTKTRNKEIAADTSLGVALVSAGISTWLFLRSSKASTTTALPEREIFAGPTPGGASAFWIERF